MSLFQLSTSPLSYFSASDTYTDQSLAAAASWLGSISDAGPAETQKGDPSCGRKEGRDDHVDLTRTILDFRALAASARSGVNTASILPAIKTYIGRTEPKNAAPTRLIPDPFSIREFMALLGSHSTGKQRTIAPAQLADSETLSHTVAPPSVFRPPSDLVFSTSATAAKDWARFLGKQDDWYGHICSACVGLAVAGSKPQTDPATDPVKLEAAIQKYRDIWLS
ncbi:hypothetical protein B0H10DRAFT_2230478 [Mycena sp. CBHHK59/15]|nr:hypothetical protein B0H10DRAFT_2230478 [Mycena sp. CBHHK59/15]